MKTVQTVAPTLLPVSLQELKNHLRLDSGTFASNIDETQSIAPGSHIVTVGYALLGTAVDVLGYSAIVSLQAGTNGATGTLDVKIQESDDNVTFTDWTGGAFTQVTTANDNDTFEKEYTGTKKYIRTVAKVLLAACEFGTTIIRRNSQVTDDALLTEKLQSAIDDAEDFTGRQLLTATWKAYLDKFPCDKDFIELPFGNLQSVTAITYKDSAGTVTTMTVTTEYLVETNGDQCGRIVLPYGCSWPSVTLYPSNPICIEFVCGWTTAALVPSKIKSAILLGATDLYNCRETKTDRQIWENKAIHNLLYGKKLWSFA